MRTLNLFSILFLLSGVYLYVGDDDYHKIIDNPGLIKYNCSMLIGGWHPDVPIKVLEECKKRKVNDNRIERSRNDTTT